MAVEDLARPRIKPEHRGYRTDAGNIRIGGVVYGTASEIEDPDGWIWDVVESADGTRAVAEIAAAVCARHPDLGAADVAGALEALYEAGFVEDAAAGRPAALSEREAERYGRGMTLLRWLDTTPRASAWEAQVLLKRASVLLIGLGGTGGAVAQQLVASGVGGLHVVDDDTVSLSNLNRQLLYTEADIGRPKVEAGVSRLRALNSHARVSGEVRRITDADGLAALLAPPRRYDLLILAADRPAHIRRWANRACLDAGLPWVDGGYSGPLVTAGVFRPGSGPCWLCVHDGEYESADLGLPAGVAEERATAHLPWNPVNAVTATLSGALMTHGALSLLTGIPALPPGLRYGFNLSTPGDEVLLDLPRRPSCPACADTPK
ncbi:ThiF family adenylyltransferase [Streptomyces sp. NPDC051940]|uniref:HesA/MoeB/ThiF family protein n=1 Tax=Streptomyces sp. NPDC051940 TaxID=3155675 RepID=UPI00341DAA90